MIFTLNIEKFTFKGLLCTNNSPVRIKIPPNGKEEKELILIMKNNRAEYYNMKFKVGFLFIDENSHVKMSQLLTGDSVFIINKEKIVWSEDLKIK
ncbi:MAG TPA: hypothetical protein VIH86_01000 [Puia sp.]